MYYTLFVRHLFRDINARQVVYFFYPVLYGIAVMSLACNSWLFFIIVSIAFFFSMDAVMIQAKNRILDISKFYSRPKSVRSLFFDYFLYRASISFVFSFLPASLIGILFFSGLRSEFELVAQNFAYAPFFLGIAGSWIIYLLVSIPVLFSGFRSHAGIEVFKAPGYLFFFGFVVAQLTMMQIAIPFSAILIFYVVAILLILSIGFYYFFKYIRQERVFPIN